ncbi:MAG: cytochrome c biogenesis protein CcdA [Bacteroidota bacterium]|nr:cytochrome c biogenesis protein CcdA [Bacteroidota bacterium]
MIKKGFLMLFFWTFLLKAQEPVVWVTDFKQLSDTEYLLIFKASMQPKWHLYSQKLPKDGPLPTEFVFEGVGSAFEFVGITKESETVTAFDPIFEMDLSWFEKEAAFQQKIRLLKPEVAAISGEINYQACDDKVCIFRNEPFSFILNSSKAIAEVKRTLDPESLKKSKALQLPLKNRRLLMQNQSQNGDNPLLNLFLLGFIGGLIALLTPCVFPMIPLTVSFFLKQSGSKSRGVGSALIYGLFILLIYIMMSLPFHFLDVLDPQILNTISTNNLMNIIFFAVFVFFAFSFFGYYELTLPSSWGNRSDAASTGRSILGIFFMALTLAIVSFSCTGPILGSLLAGSLTAEGGADQLTVGMAGFGFALALPFGLLAFFPNLLKSIPRSGGWMTKVKVTLGFLELALALKFLSNADLVGHWGIIKREIFVGIWLIISILLFIYLLGWLRFPNDQKGSKIPMMQRFFTFLVLIFIFYLIPGLRKNQDGQLSLLSGFPPPVFYSVYPSYSECPLGLNCFKDYDKGRAYAEAKNKPILLDFTGWACVNCRKMEENVWSQPEIFNLLNEDFVIISLYVDDRKELPEGQKFEFKYPSGRIKTIKTIGEKWATFQSLNFTSASQPYYVLMSSDETILNSPIQYTNAKTYKDWLQSGLELHRQITKQPSSYTF